MTDPDGPWDVLVVGAGPAGASAARVAAERGASVLLLDKAHFPRYKTCGGGLTGISRRYLHPAADGAIETQITEVGFSRQMGRVIRHSQSDAALWMVRREIFDQANVDAAVAAGAAFRDGANVRSIDQDAGGVTIATDDRIFRARVLVGADGAGGRIGRYVGVDLAHIDLGLELEFPVADPGRWAGSIRLDWGREPGSYAWVFPKADRLAVGVIAAKGDHRSTRDYLNRWVTHLGLGAIDAEHDSGHLTHARRPGSPVSRGRVILAGEAGGFLDPWTREGISFALRSGTWAGDHAARFADGDATALERYDRLVRARLDPEVAAGSRLLHLFQRHLRLMNVFIAHTRVGAGIFFRVCRGTLTVAEVMRHRSVRVLMRILDR